MTRAAFARISFTVAAFAALFASACAKKEAPPPPTPSVEVATVIQKDVPVFQEWIGSLDGFVNAEIRPQIEGYLLKQNYREGFPVHAGEALFEIDPRQFQATYDQAKASLAQYEATLANAKTTTARYRPLAASKAISQQELDDAETRELTAAANLESAKAALEKAQLDLGWTKVVSPHRRHRGRRQVPGRRPRQPADRHDDGFPGESDQGQLQSERAGVPGVGRPPRIAREDAADRREPRAGPSAADPLRRLCLSRTAAGRSSWAARWT